MLNQQPEMRPSRTGRREASISGDRSDRLSLLITSVYRVLRVETEVAESALLPRVAIEVAPLAEPCDGFRPLLCVCTLASERGKSCPAPETCLVSKWEIFFGTEHRIEHLGRKVSLATDLSLNFVFSLGIYMNVPALTCVCLMTQKCGFLAPRALIVC